MNHATTASVLAFALLLGGCAARRETRAHPQATIQEEQPPSPTNDSSGKASDGVGAIREAQIEPELMREPERPPSPPDDSDWKVSVRAGAAVAPSYVGDDSYQLLVFPDVSVEKSDFFFSLFQGAGYNLINSDGWRAGPIAKYQFGRQEDGDNPLRIAGDVTDDLRGLGDVDDTIEVGGFLEFRFECFTSRLELRQGIGGHEGLIGELGFSLQCPVDVLGKTMFLSVGTDLDFGDASYNSSYFGINAAQSAASRLAPYDADGIFLSAGLNASLAIPVTDRFTIIPFAGYSRLFGDAAQSSLVQERGSENQFSGGLIFSYRF